VAVRFPEPRRNPRDLENILMFLVLKRNILIIDIEQDERGKQLEEVYKIFMRNH
jgi:hypothetical protein